MRMQVVSTHMLFEENTSSSGSSQLRRADFCTTEHSNKDTS